MCEVSNVNSSNINQIDDNGDHGDSGNDKDSSQDRRGRGDESVEVNDPISRNNTNNPKSGHCDNLRSRL